MDRSLLDTGGDSGVKQGKQCSQSVLILPVGVLDNLVNSTDAVTGRHLDPNKAILAPVRAPRVLHNPVWSASIIELAARRRLIAAEPPFVDDAVANWVWVGGGLGVGGGVGVGAIVGVDVAAAIFVANDSDSVVESFPASASRSDNTGVIVHEGIWSGCHRDIKWLLYNARHHSVN